MNTVFQKKRAAQRQLQEAMKRTQWCRNEVAKKTVLLRRQKLKETTITRKVNELMLQCLRAASKANAIRRRRFFF